MIHLLLDCQGTDLRMSSETHEPFFTFANFMLCGSPTVELSATKAGSPDFYFMSCEADGREMCALTVCIFRSFNERITS